MSTKVGEPRVQTIFMQRAKQRVKSGARDAAVLIAPIPTAVTAYTTNLVRGKSRREAAEATRELFASTTNSVKECIQNCAVLYAPIPTAVATYTANFVRGNSSRESAEATRELFASTTNTIKEAIKNDWESIFSK